EELAQEPDQRPLQVAHRYALADHEAFDLLEHRRVGEVQVVAAVDAARRDDAHGRLVRLHVADLHRRRVRAKQGGGALVTCSNVRGRSPAATYWTGKRLRQVQRVLHV